MSGKKVNGEEIAKFLEGSDPQKYIVNIEVPYSSPYADMIINDPEQGKYIEHKRFKPFVWMKREVSDILYGGNRTKIRKKAREFGVKFEELITEREDGFKPERLKDGYKYLATTKQSYAKLINFFRQGGVHIYDEKYRHLFMAVTPVEQFMIQTGKRLFKGFDDYSDLHRFQFDLETTGLDPKIARIFQIGVRDNRGVEEITEVTGETEEEKNISEKNAIIALFKVIDALKPDIITGYNSENFDWEFIEVRCQILGLNIKDIAITLDMEKGRFRRKEGTLKLGGNTEKYLQAILWGHSILDIWHAVRKAKAINSDIKETGLKYITKFSEIEKENRVYVPGDMLNTIWADKENDYYFNDKNGDWFKVIEDDGDVDEKLIKNQKDKINGDEYEKVKGSFIIRRYLLDDLWETEKVDSIYNQATFLISKLIPTTLMKSATMGTAGTWKLIMMSWSYHNNLALPSLEEKRDFTGGLSRLTEVGFAERVAKLDYAALYPNIELTHDIFPDLDITGVMEGLLFYIVSQRDTYKFLKKDHSIIAKDFKLKLDKEPNNEEYIKGYKENSFLSSNYDKKQLPLKILANSFFGSFGASYLFNWGDINCAEETTCRGRQYLRLMVRHFYEKYGFRPLVGDSVTFNTPIYIRYKETNQIDIKPICDIFNAESKVLDEDQLRDFEEKPYEVLTVNGWKNIQYTYRHGTKKKIHRVNTKDRLVCVTEDHSLFQDGVQVKPSTLKRGDSIDVYKLPQHNSTSKEMSTDLYWLLGYFLGNGSALDGPRKVYYKSKKTSKINTNKGIRGDWKISSNNLKNLEKLKSILENEWDEELTISIKDHRKSSSVYDLVVYKTQFSQFFCEQFYTSFREKKVPSFVLNASLENKRVFMDGVCASDGYGDSMDTVSDIGMKSQVAMSGIGYLLNCLGVQYKLKLRKDKENFISFKLRNRNRNNSEFTDKTLMKTDEVWSNQTIQNRDKENFVYDISTEDGTFVGGIGGINLKNTDGYNFAIPDTIDEVAYEVKGTHRMTEKNKGETLIGLDGVVADFNEKYMIGRMGLDIDDICDTTINFSRKNYGNKMGNKIKLVGNTIKSSKLAGYQEDFMNVAIKLLLEGKGEEFIELYYQTVDNIFNYRIPIRKIASKSKVNQTMEEYEEYCKGRNKAGVLNARKSFMELIKQHDLRVNNGDIIYYVNVGSAKSHGDLKTTKKDGVVVKVDLMCKLIPNEQLEKNPDLTTDEYNVPKYLDMLNKRIAPLLVCFDDEVRENLIIKTKKNRKTKEIELTEKHSFTSSQCKLISGKPLKGSVQDTYEDLMIMEDKEIRFWAASGMEPNNMPNEEWNEIREDYFLRKQVERKRGVEMELKRLKEIFKGLLSTDYENFINKNIIPHSVLRIVGLKSIKDEEDNVVDILLVSNNYKENYYSINHFTSHYGYVKLKEEFFTTLNVKAEEDEKEEEWNKYISEIQFREGDERLIEMINEKSKESELKIPEYSDIKVNVELMPTKEEELYRKNENAKVVEIVESEPELPIETNDNEWEYDFEWNF